MDCVWPKERQVLIPIKQLNEFKGHGFIDKSDGHVEEDGPHYVRVELPPLWTIERIYAPEDSRLYYLYKPSGGLGVVVTGDLGKEDGKLNVRCTIHATRYRRDDETAPSALETYQEKNQEFRAMYFKFSLIVNGTTRGELDAAYNEMLDAWTALSRQDKAQHPLPSEPRL